MVRIYRCGHPQGGKGLRNTGLCAPEPWALCAWCVPPLHMHATPNCSARRAASTALRVAITGSQ